MQMYVRMLITWVHFW